MTEANSLYRELVQCYAEEVARTVEPFAADVADEGGGMREYVYSEACRMYPALYPQNWRDIADTTMKILGGL